MIVGWWACHKDTGKWHKIEDIKDTGISAEEKGGGNNYHLEGVGPVHQSKISDMAHKPMEKSETLEKGKCVRCGNSSRNGGSGGRCNACLKKLKTARHTPGTYQRNHQQADSALRRQDGKNGTASHKSSGRGSRKEIVGKMKRAEKKTGQKLSADRTDNNKGYASKNVRAIPEKLNRGRHKADPKKLAEWRKRLKKANVDIDDFLTLLKAKMLAKGDEFINLFKDS